MRTARTALGLASPTRILLASSGAALVALTPAVAGAQNDITTVLPNVLLLIDSSGSMEYLIQTGSDGLTEITPESADTNALGAACTPTGAGGTTTVMTRWASLASVLTGSFQQGAFGCQTIDRTANANFVAEYALPPAGSKPYDFGYFLPWHRIFSNGCTIGALQPVNVAQDWTNWGAQPYDYHTYQGTSASNGSYQCNWTGQNSDGILDIFAGLARFGMMTFDTLPDPGTGSTLSPSTQINGATGAKGMWSYFHNWQTASPPASAAAASGQPNTNRPAAGNPDACGTVGYMEVGARNVSAPPWEGPMVPFGDWSTDTNVAQTNAKIQLELLSMRPYGSTPIAGMLDDAKEFLFGDTTKMPGSTTVAFGPSGPNPDGSNGDQYWINGCRRTFMILLTDGEPNMDLRGASGNCDVTPGNAANPPHCPYLPADQILTNLRTAPPAPAILPQQSVTTYVVGFAMSKPTALAQVNASYTSCSQLTAADCGSPTLPPAVKPCCTLQKLATAGADPLDPVFLPGNDPVTGPHATPHAFFADSPGQLKQVLSTILTQGIGKRTARTAPVYAVAPSDPTAQGSLPAAGRALSYHFSASFNVTSSSQSGNVSQGGGANGLWSGNVVRERYACDATGVANPVTPDPTRGDFFAHNVDNNALGTRKLWTVIGKTDVGNAINSDWTIRPNLTTDDGFGLSTPVPTPPTPALTSGAGFPALMSNYPAAFGIGNGNDANCKSAFGIVNQPQNCVTYAVNWEIGGINSALGPTSPSRDPTLVYCQAIPNLMCSKIGAVYHSTPVVAGPPREFLRDDTYTAYANSPGVATQPVVLYTATMDGQLHAFKVTASTSTDTPLVDTDTVNNEIWSFFPPAVLQHILPNFNTGGANLLDGAPVIADVPSLYPVGHLPPVFERTPASAPQWHRVLVAGGGAAGGFYYALDITDPYNPTFLWQISTDSSGHPLFGNNTPTPAITIVAITENGTRTQVPVAVLPGGGGQQAPACPNPPAHPSTNGLLRNDPANPSNPTGTVYNLAGYAAPDLRCWSTNSTNSQGNNGLGNFHNGTAATGNSVTIVRLDTGQVLSHLTGVGYFGWTGNGHQGDSGDHASSANTATTLAISAPMVGTPSVYPAQTGQVADRAYLGDADGQLWRLDLSDSTPANWSLTLAWDAYFDSSTTTIRDAAQLAPVLSTDPVGNVIINFATGDQNLLTATASSNRIWSLTETPAAHITSQNWVIKFAAPVGGACPGGQICGHVTGPMALFNEVLYYSTFQPLTTAPLCAPGQANLTGVDYRRPLQPPGPTLGVPFSKFIGTPTTDGSVIMGVSTTELPSCGGSSTTSDPYFGSHTQVTGANQSEYRIMWQTGTGTGISGGGVRSETGVQGMQNMTIPPPGQSTRIDSWAAIVE